MSNPETAPTRASRRGQHATRSELPASEPSRPRPVVAAASIVLGLALALAATNQSDALMLGSYIAAVLCVGCGLPLLAAVPAPRSSASVIVATGIGLAVSRAATDTEPLLEVAPVAAGIGIVLMCLVPLVHARARAQLTPWLTATAMGIAVALCGIVLTIVESDERAPVVVAGVAVAVSALVDLALERPRLHVWMLPVAMVAGGAAGLLVELVVSGEVLLWAVLVGVLSAGVALAVRRLVSRQQALEHPVAALAAGATSVLVVGPVVLTLARTFLG
ncbi:hypothetical protein GCM10009633_29040 [Janibacter melonis]|uniref:hypothetical protein n=1 Tax=Janibacter melonis TaxID=262209 RepID=UPI001E43EF2A|nr:hypothetical protein [Janibacter melonis]MCB5991610.1 hypothetical protein [Janibacter melonis]